MLISFYKEKYDLKFGTDGSSDFQCETWTVLSVSCQVGMGLELKSTPAVGHALSRGCIEAFSAGHLLSFLVSWAQD